MNNPECNKNPEYKKIPIVIVSYTCLLTSYRFEYLTAKIFVVTELFTANVTSKDVGETFHINDTEVISCHCQIVTS